MRMQDLMSERVETVSVDSPMSLARQSMRLRGIRHLVVMDGVEVVGILSDRDSPDGIGSVRDHMSAPVVTASGRTTLREAANLLRGHAIGCLPIVDGGRLKGIVTIADLLEVLGRGALRPSPVGIRPVLKDRGPRPRRRLV